MYAFNFLPNQRKSHPPLPFRFDQWDSQFVRHWQWDAKFGERYVQTIYDLTPDEVLSRMDRTFTPGILTQRVLAPSLRQSQPWYLLLRIAVDSWLRAEQFYDTGTYPSGSKMLTNFGPTFNDVYKEAMRKHGRSRAELEQFVKQWIDARAMLRHERDLTRKGLDPMRLKLTVCKRDGEPPKVMAYDFETQWPLAGADYSSLERRILAYSTPLSKDSDILNLFLKKDRNMNSESLFSLGTGTASNTASRSEADFDKAYAAARPGTWVAPVIIGFDPENGSPIYSERVFKPAIVPGDELLVGQQYVLQTLGDGYAPDFVQEGLRVVALSDGEGFYGDVMLTDGTHRVFTTDGTDQYTLI